MTPCYIGLGANLGNCLAALCRAADALETLPQCRAGGRSSIYRSAAIGPGDQPDYLNAVLALHTKLQPLALLDALQSLEQEAGRRRDLRWGARTLDLDLLLYDDLRLDTARLTLPHPRLFERNFVLQPLSELLPRHYLFPDDSTLKQRLSQCPDNPLQRTQLAWNAMSTEPEAARA